MSRETADLNRVYNPDETHYNNCASFKNTAKGDFIMEDAGLIAVTIDRYGDLQRIKKANGGYENKELDYIIKVTALKLYYLGVNVEDITLE